MGAFTNHVLPLGSLSPADPLNGAGSSTSALIICRVVEVRRQEVGILQRSDGYYVCKKFSILSLRLRGLTAGGVTAGIQNFSGKLMHSLCK